MTATLRGVAATFLPDTQTSQRRAVALIAAGTVLILAVVIAWAAGRSAGYDNGRTAGIETGRVEALRECGAGLDNGFLGNVASFTAPRGHRTVVCVVPDEIFAD